MNKIDTVNKIFEGKKIRSVWDSDKEEYYFSVIDVIGALTNNGYQKSRNYLEMVKRETDKWR